MLETVFNVLKVTVAIAIAAIFLVAINALFSFIGNIVFGNVVGEFLALISMYMPFNASVVFASIGSAILAISAFLVAKKIFDLTSWTVSSV